MSFQSKGFWMKDAGCLIDGELTYDNASRIEPKRLHQWFMDGSEAELFPNKKQAVEVQSSNSFGGIPTSTLSPWGNVPSFLSVPNPLSERLFDPEATRSMNFHEGDIASGSARNLEMGRKVMDDPFVNTSSFDLSMSHSLLDPKTGINYGGLRKVKVNEVRDSVNLMSMSMEASMGPSYDVTVDNNVIPAVHGYDKVDDCGISMGLTYGQEEDNIINIGDSFGREDDNFVSIGQSFDKDDVNKMNLGCNYKADSNTISLENSFGNGGSNILSIAGVDSNVISMGTFSKVGDNIVSLSQTYEGGESLVSLSNQYGKGVDINRTISMAQSNKGKCHGSSMGHSFDKGARNIISFGGCNNDDDDDVNASGRLISSYDLLMSQTSAPRSNTLNNKELVVSDTNVLINTAHGLVATADMTNKKKDDPKSNKKTPPNNFPSNVRSLLSTGILDEVPVKYIAWSREKELRGVIKGSGYLCGCQSCNFSKVINAYEFERHASSKTKHPNNHIYFENGKTIYGIVQELRSTPQNMLFDVIQTITGSPINQKSFRLWKESFLAATRELQRIYGKDERDQPVRRSSN